MPGHFRGLLLVLLLAIGAPVAAAQLPAAQERQPPSGVTFSERLLLPLNLPGRDAALVVIPGDPVLQDRLRVVHWPGDEARADRVIRVLEQSPYLPGLPAEVPRRAVIFLTPDRERWDALTGGSVPHWGAGVAIPDLARIVIPLQGAPGGGLAGRDRTVLHEWAHLGLHEHLSGLRIPRWFDEGYAQWASGGWDVEEAWRLRVGLARGGAPPLDSLRLAWPRDQAGAELAYLLSASAIEFLAAGSGERGMEVLLERWKESGDFEEAFRRTFGTTTATFERRWIAHVKRRYGWILVFSQTMMLWLFLGVLLLLVGWKRRQFTRDRLARLRAADPPDAPAWWEGPPTPPIGGFRSDVERSRPVDRSREVE